MSPKSVDIPAWKQMEKFVDEGDADRLEAFLRLMAPGDTPHAINRLSEEYQTKLLSIVRPDLAARLMEHLADAQVADLIE